MKDRPKTKSQRKAVASAMAGDVSARVAAVTNPAISAGRDRLGTPSVGSGQVLARPGDRFHRFVG